jgi:hypothetical protein
LTFQYEIPCIAIKIQKSTKRPTFLMIFLLRKQFFEKIIIGSAGN